MFHLILRAALGVFGGGGTDGQTMQVDQALLDASVRKSLATFDEFLKRRERDLVKILKTESWNVTARAALATPPLNGGGLRKAEEDMETDINFIFPKLAEIPFGELVMAREWVAVNAYNFKFNSKILQKAYDEGDWEIIHNAFAKGGMGEWAPYTGENLTTIDAPNTKFHKMGRGKDGKLNGRRFHVRGSYDEADSKTQDYVRQAAAAIGQMAGGWVSCYVKLQGNGWNLPIEYASKGKGTIKVKWWGEQKEVTMTNPVGNFGGFISQRPAIFESIMRDAGQNVKDRHVKNSNELLKMHKMQ